MKFIGSYKYRYYNFTIMQHIKRFSPSNLITDSLMIPFKMLLLLHGERCNNEGNFY